MPWVPSITVVAPLTSFQFAKSFSKLGLGTNRLLTQTLAFGVGVKVAVAVWVAVAVGVRVAVGVLVGPPGVGVTVGVLVGPAGVAVTVGVRVAVAVDVAVGVDVGAAATIRKQKSSTESSCAGLATLA